MQQKGLSKLCMEITQSGLTNIFEKKKNTFFFTTKVLFAIMYLTCAFLLMVKKMRQLEQYHTKKTNNCSATYVAWLISIIDTALGRASIAERTRKRLWDASNVERGFI
jgi:hypothetical protein